MTLNARNAKAQGIRGAGNAPHHRRRGDSIAPISALHSSFLANVRSWINLALVTISSTNDRRVDQSKASIIVRRVRVGRKSEVRCANAGRSYRPGRTL